MSGGHFDYAYRHVNNFADSLEIDILNNSVKDEADEWAYCPDYNEEVLGELTKILNQARYLSEMMKEAEWLYSGDTGEESFMERIKEIKRAIWT